MYATMMSFKRVLRSVDQIAEQMEAISDLNGIRRSAARSICVTTGAVTADELDAPVRTQPLLFNMPPTADSWIERPCSGRSARD